MLRMDLYNVLISPVITEKANTVAEKNEQVVFKVLKQATKAEIKAAFEIVPEGCTSIGKIIGRCAI